VCPRRLTSNPAFIRSDVPGTTQTTAKPRPAAVPSGDRFTTKQKLALLVMSVTILVISLDGTVLNVALPTLVRDLRPSSSGLQWIAASYTLANAVLLLFGGALGDRYGRRLIFLIGLAIFGAGSLACAMVHDTGALVLSRTIMGVGAALLVPCTLAIIATTFTGPSRARAIGIWAGVSGIGSAAGPLLGGYLLQHFWWGSVFLINVPIVIVALIGAFLVVPESRADQPPPLDPIGVALSSLGLAALTYALIELPDHGWESTTVIGSVMVSIALLVAFGVWDSRRETPLLDLTLFRNRVFSSALAVVTASFFAMFGVSYLISQYMQFVQGADPLGVGLRFLPSAIGTLITSNNAARLTVRYGLRAVIMAGLGLITTALVIIATLSVNSGTVPLVTALTLLGCGMGLVIAPASNAIISTLPMNKIGVGAGVRSTVQFLGGSFGVAIIGSLATAKFRAEMNNGFHGPLHAVPEAARSSISDQIGQAVLAVGSLPVELGRLVVTQAQHAFVSGLHLSAYVGIGVLLLSLGIATLIPRRIVAPGPDSTEDPPVGAMH
jgi:EmrB/QacA subfamily drug resistance transporter